MTPRVILLWTFAYLVLFAVAIWFTRSTSRRILGSVIGGAAAGLWSVAAIGLCESLGWWRIPTVAPLLFYVGVSITLMPIYLVTWRIARRFPRRGLLVFTAIVGLIGPPRDYLYATLYPQWMVFSPGALPIFADGLTYIGIVLIGHAVMRLVAGPAGEDRLARTNLDK